MYVKVCMYVFVFVFQDMLVLSARANRGSILKYIHKKCKHLHIFFPLSVKNLCV